MSELRYGRNASVSRRGFKTTTSDDVKRSNGKSRQYTRRQGKLKQRDDILTKTEEGMPGITRTIREMKVSDGLVSGLDTAEG